MHTLLSRFASLILLCAASVRSMPAAGWCASAPTAPPDSAPATAPAMSAEDRLAASLKLYAQAKTYRDEGTLTSKSNAGGYPINETKPFSTAFERDGRFRWEFRHSSMPGRALDQHFTITSKDGQTFESHWTVSGQTDKDQSLDMPLGAATGISGGSAVAIVPLLKMSGLRMQFGLFVTALEKLADSGKEAVDDVECWRITGTRSTDQSKIGLWIDDQGLIRKITCESVVDPSKFPKEQREGMPNIPKFTVYTTITIKPFINEPKIDDEKFADADAKHAPDR